MATLYTVYTVHVYIKAVMISEYTGCPRHYGLRKSAVVSLFLDFRAPRLGANSF